MSPVDGPGFVHGIRDEQLLPLMPKDSSRTATISSTGISVPMILSRLDQVFDDHNSTIPMSSPITNKGKPRSKRPTVIVSTNRVRLESIVVERIPVTAPRDANYRFTS